MPSEVVFNGLTVAPSPLLGIQEAGITGGYQAYWAFMCILEAQAPVLVPSGQVFYPQSLLDNP